MIKTAHPNVWEFTERLREVATGAIRDYDRVTRGIRISWPRKQKYILNDRNIADKTAKLSSSRITTYEFLISLANGHSTPETVDEGDNDDEDQNDDEDEDEDENENDSSEDSDMEEYYDNNNNNGKRKISTFFAVQFYLNRLSVHIFFRNC